MSADTQSGHGDVWRRRSGSHDADALRAHGCRQRRRDIGEEDDLVWRRARGRGGKGQRGLEVGRPAFRLEPLNRRSRSSPVRCCGLHECRRGAGANDRDHSAPRQSVERLDRLSPCVLEPRGAGLSRVHARGSIENQHDALSPATRQDRSGQRGRGGRHDGQLHQQFGVGPQPLEAGAAPDVLLRGAPEEQVRNLKPRSSPPSKMKEDENRQQQKPGERQRMQDRHAAHRGSQIPPRIACAANSSKVEELLARR